MRAHHNRRGGYRSLFWPIVLITVGMIWLLWNTGVLSGVNLMVLVRLWPLLLIAIGLDLLFGRSSPALSALIGLGTVALAVILMLIGPSIGLVQELETQTAQFNEPLEDASSARVELDLGVGFTTIAALSDSNDLFDADLTYIGEVDFEMRGEREKTITLRHREFDLGFNFLGINWFDSDSNNLRWDIGLSPAVPLALDLSVGVGGGRFDLSGLDVTGLSIDGGVGDVTLTLPATDHVYSVEINGEVGGFTIAIVEGAALDMVLRGNIGDFTIDVPDGAAARVEAETDIGDVDVPGSFERISGDDEGLGERGVWQTDNYERAERRITLEFHGNIGGLTVR